MTLKVGKKTIQVKFVIAVAVNPRDAIRKVATWKLFKPSTWFSPPNIHREDWYDLVIVYKDKKDKVCQDVMSTSRDANETQKLLIDVHNQIGQQASTEDKK